MTDYEFVCHECGRTFRGLTTRIGEEMCPACGSRDEQRTRRRLTGRAAAGRGAGVVEGPNGAYRIGA